MNILQQKTIKISILGYCQTYTNIAIEWGREHKKFAVDINLLKARELHPPLTYQETGDKLSGKPPPQPRCKPWWTSGLSRLLSKWSVPAALKCVYNRAPLSDIFFLFFIKKRIYDWRKPMHIVTNSSNNGYPKKCHFIVLTYMCYKNCGKTLNLPCRWCFKSLQIIFKLWSWCLMKMKKIIHWIVIYTCFHKE